MHSSNPRKAGSVWKTALAWLTILAVTFGMLAFWLWPESGRHSDVPAQGPGFSIFLFVIGALSVFTGVAAYFVILATNCFRADFSKPMWNDMKTRIYVANIFVPLMVMMGIGFMLSVFLTPMLRNHGVSESMAQLLPMMGCIGLMQIVLVWFVIWAPLEKSLIEKRLTARGLSAEQMRTGIYVGLSNPDKSSLKKFTCIEEDMGMLWFDPDQLIYWGDAEAFSLQRDDVLEVERQVDAASTTALSGTAHVVLRVKQVTNDRRIRLHCEGILTMGRKRSAMNQLAERITHWRSQGTTGR